MKFNSKWKKNFYTHIINYYIFKIYHFQLARAWFDQDLIQKNPSLCWRQNDYNFYWYVRNIMLFSSLCALYLVWVPGVVTNAVLAVSWHQGN